MFLEKPMLSARWQTRDQARLSSPPSSPLYTSFLKKKNSIYCHPLQILVVMPKSGSWGVCKEAAGGGSSKPMSLKVLLEYFNGATDRSFKTPHELQPCSSFVLCFVASSWECSPNEKVSQRFCSWKLRQSDQRFFLPVFKPAAFVHELAILLPHADFFPAILLPGWEASVIKWRAGCE